MKQSAIYTRVSTSQQADKEYNSCDAQRDKILSYINSQEKLEVYKEYEDPGYTGANLDRPALSELLNDISQGKINVVLTYKIDRLTRSSRDFYSLIEFFEKYNVSYISVTEHFDTSSPSGRLLRNIMLTFAQFEREMIADRVKHTLFQRAVKGLWNGGGRPFGYRRIDGKLVIDSKEAPIIRKIFEHFVMTGSLFQTYRMVKHLDFKATNPRCPNSVSGIGYLLRNPLYIGFLRWGDKIYKGQHEPIISNDLYNQAQLSTKKKEVTRKLYKKFLLGGLVECSDCKSTMTHSFTNKPEKRYYYYKCVKVVKEGKNACTVKEINADKLEKFVLENLCRIAHDSHYIESFAYKKIYSSPNHSGFELLEEQVKKLSGAISKALEDFRSDLSSKTQVEKILLIRKAIQKIRFSKTLVEVVVALRDRAHLQMPMPIHSPRGNQAAGIHAENENPAPPSGNARFDVQDGGLVSALSNFQPETIKFDLVMMNNLSESKETLKG
ncbi:MAG: recombinase family protein [Thermodesulfobacteriota bacterium]